MKIRSTDYYSKNLETYGKDYYRSKLSIKGMPVARWRRKLSRYSIYNYMKIHIRCKTNFPGTILKSLDRHGFKVETITDQDIFCSIKFNEKILANWDNSKRFTNQVLTHNKYVVQNKLRGIKQRFEVWILWFEITENKIDYSLEKSFNIVTLRQTRLR